MKQAPILVTGAPRSSTTFLGKMLSLPPHVLYVDEPFNVLTGIEGTKATFPSPVHEAGLAGLDEAHEEVVQKLLTGDARFKPSMLRQSTSNPLRQLARELWVSRENLDYRLQSKNPLKQRYLIKDPMAFSLSEYLHKRFDMQTVVIMRHPLSIIASYKRLDWHYDIGELLTWARTMSDELDEAMKGLGDTAVTSLGELEQWALFWLGVYGVLDYFMKRNPAMIFVRHEDLSLDPHKTLAELYKKLGLEYTPRISRKVTGYTSAKNPTIPAENRVHVLHRNSAENVTRWKHILDPTEAATIRKLTARLAGRFYPESSWG